MWGSPWKDALPDSVSGGGTYGSYHGYRGTGGGPTGVCLDGASEDTWLPGMKRGVFPHAAAVPMWWGCENKWGIAEGV